MFLRFGSLDFKGRGGGGLGWLRHDFDGPNGMMTFCVFVLSGFRP